MTEETIFPDAAVGHRRPHPRKIVSIEYHKFCRRRVIAVYSVCVLGMVLLFARDVLQGTPHLLQESLVRSLVIGFFLALILWNRRRALPTDNQMLAAVSAVGFLVIFNSLRNEEPFRVYLLALVSLGFIFVPVSRRTIAIGMGILLSGVAALIWRGLYSQHEAAFLAAFFTILFVIVLILGSANTGVIRTVFSQKRELSKEKQKSESLILNILPVRIVNELKETGTTQPETFHDVAIFFSDMVGFTRQVSDLPPHVLINELTDIFTAFDDIMARHYCERIKTIGDAYMAVCGMSQKVGNSTLNLMDAAAEILAYLTGRNDGSPIRWEIRVGLHVGTVVGGVVGKRRYIYDIFGDAVNVAARMEQHSEPMTINCSEAIHLKARHVRAFKERPPIEVKGKGPMRMYFYPG